MCNLKLTSPVLSSNIWWNIHPFVGCPKGADPTPTPPPSPVLRPSRTPGTRNYPVLSRVEESLENDVSLNSGLCTMDSGT